MLKEVVILNGKIYNYGPWDYQYTEVDGEQVAQNPFPEGGTIEQRNCEYDPDRGMYEVGTVVFDPDVELTKAILAATTLDELKKALTGTNGKPVKVTGKLK